MRFEQIAETRCQQPKEKPIPLGKLKDCLVLWTDKKGGSIKRGKGEKICDHIVVCETKSQLLIALIESKSNTLDRAIEQLKECEKFLLVVLKGIDAKKPEPPLIRAAIYSHGGRHPKELKPLAVKSNFIAGRAIRPKKFGQPIENLFKE